ncbi:MAG: adenylate/guanylate cyclase domain-containing protein [Solirubrobacterales bacterium]|nr:adenylate/guanylate cyclase domain-containing protein [Solirubrobacterales bacterium]
MPYPLPEDPTLAAVASAMEATGQWAWVVDERWRIVYATDAVRITYGGGDGELAHFPIGCHLFGPEWLEAARTWRFGPNAAEQIALTLEAAGGWAFADTPGGAAELREAVDPQLRDAVDGLREQSGEALSFVARGMGIGHAVDVPVAALRLRRPDGGLAGTLMVFKPAASMAVLSDFASMSDLGHLERMQQVSRAARRPAAILFADLEGSSALARRLSTAGYFAVGRRLVRAADACVIEAGGLVGRHVGDGIGALFPAQTAGSESAAARSCIAAARTLRATLAGVAARSDLAPEDVVLRCGLHWGPRPYIGAVTTAGRWEVIALGDEVNEAARIEACATGGRALASKDLLERLDGDDRAALGLDPDHLTYTVLADLATATEKARRDASAIAVCAI